MSTTNYNKLLEIRDVIRTEESRINYLRGLIRIAECDKNKTAGEEEYIYKIAEVIGASYSEIMQAGDYQEDNESAGIHFETDQEKMLFLMQALYLCWVDDDYSEAEQEEIITIGEELGIDRQEITAVESWIKQGMEWMETGAELLKLE